MGDALGGQQLVDKSDRPKYVRVKTLGSGAFGLVEVRPVSVHKTYHIHSHFSTLVTELCSCSSCMHAKLKWPAAQLAINRDTGEQVAIKLLERGPTITRGTERELRSHISFCRACLLPACITYQSLRNICLEATSDKLPVLQIRTWSGSRTCS